MNAASQQRLPIENEMQRKEGDLRVVKQSDEPLTRGGPTLTQMGVRKRNRGDVGFPSSVRISSFNDTASEDVLPFQRERSFSIESSEEEETGVQMVLEDATASPNRPKERTRTGHPENTGRVDENSAGVAGMLIYAWFTSLS
ncbi:hypothetical protein Tcan_08930 [Toxocara canis]|uniref:Uncharacterized protein n=1 Tax=Toxocara canis TaxID=6265 RepID=A0A0B2VVA7_TOXCA|nr:hypothetical protein Tcan_08930 [Toxocara canis]